MAIDGRALISGAGIAGLTLAICLKEYGDDPVVVEQSPALPDDGYMMDFFGSGWDVAERMGLTGALRALRYPIDKLQFVNAEGKSYATVPIKRIKRALDGKYVYLRRPDLVRILYERAEALGVEVRFGTEIADIRDQGTHVDVAFDDGSTDEFALVFGADGVHSGVRRLMFGDESQFARFLGAYVAAFHIEDHDLPVGQVAQIHEEPNRVAFYYPLGDRKLDATFVFRLDEVDVPPEQQLSFVRRAFKGAGWIGEALIDAYKGSAPLYFDTMTQIAIPRWSRGRVTLLGDACGCLSLLAGQGSHMAMAGAYILAQELQRYDGNHAAAFASYEAMMKPAIAERQEDASAFAKIFIPTAQSKPWLRRLVIQTAFNPLVLPFAFRAFGSRSILEDDEV
ncbi:FAD-dependent monooxygenase [Methyloceanibacter methanicus]|uniref:FAD-dependent monooxygenase n=1 Tax=Methyloceanibacter methanicus TaxID=1774968 RepID=UPI0009F514FD|nr:FAD-dependent monooxygenase [Methyloceanibacter methanicus]